MYTAFYGLREKPFALSPDPRFLYLAGSHREALAAREAFRLPARGDLPEDLLPPWAAEVQREMVVAEVDWSLIEERSADWMTEWDRTVRGRGANP